jgi:hypothetical protein
MQPSPTNLTQAAHNSKPGRRVLAAQVCAFGAAALAVAILAGSVLAASAVKNGSFEKDSNGDGIPNNWGGYSLSPSDKRVCNQSYAGDCSFKMVGEGGTSDKLVFQGLDVAGVAGDTFTLKMWVKTKDLVSGAGFATIYLVLYQTDGGYDQAAVNIEEGTMGWTLYTFDLAATETYDGGIVQVEF